jgi:hypothetical protein
MFYYALLHCQLTCNIDCSVMLLYVSRFFIFTANTFAEYAFAGHGLQPVRLSAVVIYLSSVSKSLGRAKESWCLHLTLLEVLEHWKDMLFFEM